MFDKNLELRVCWLSAISRNVSFHLKKMLKFLHFSGGIFNDFLPKNKRNSLIYVIEVCTGPGQASKWRVIFFQWAGAANERWFLQQVGLDWHMRGDFLNRLAKKKWVFQKLVRATKKQKKTQGRSIILPVSS